MHEVGKHIETIKWLETIQNDLVKIRNLAGTFGYGDDPLYTEMDKCNNSITKMVGQLQLQMGQEMCKT